MKIFKNMMVVLASAYDIVVHVIALSLIFVLFHSRLLGASLERQLTDYYSYDKGYVTLYGTIKEENYYATFDQLIIQIELSIKNGFFPSDEETGFNTFVLVNWTEQDFSLDVNDTITFMSAPIPFGKGHIFPILSISNNGEELLSVEEGKANYLSWIKESFN